MIYLHDYCFRGLKCYNYQFMGSLHNLTESYWQHDWKLLHWYLPPSPTPHCSQFIDGEWRTMVLRRFLKTIQVGENSFLIPRIFKKEECTKRTKICIIHTLEDFPWTLADLPCPLAHGKPWRSSSFTHVYVFMRPYTFAAEKKFIFSLFSKLDRRKKLNSHLTL